MNHKAVFIKIFTAILILVTFSACGPEPSKLFNSNEQPADKKVELRFAWWGGEERHKATINAINKYMDLNPCIEIKAEYSGFEGYNQKISTQLAAGTAPDIMQMDYFYMTEFAEQGKSFIDFYEYKDIIDLTTFDEQILKVFSEVNKQLVGIPTGINSIVFFGNKNVLEQHNINFESKYNWETLVEKGKQINQENPNHYLLNMGPGEMSLLMAYYIQQKSGKNFIEDDYSLGFDQALLVDTFTYMKRLWDEGVVPDISEYATLLGKIEQTPKWVSGDLGIVIMSASGIDFFKNSNNELMPMLPPIREDAKETGIRTQPSQIFSVSNDSREAEEAIKFIHWLLNDEEAIKTLGSVRGVQPTEKGRKILTDANLIDPLISEAVRLGQENRGLIINSISLNTEVNKMYKDTVEKIGYERITPEEGAEQLINQLNRFLDDIKP